MALLLLHSIYLNLIPDFTGTFTYYQGRVDKLFVNLEGDFVVIKGKPDDNPDAPDNLKDFSASSNVLNNIPYVFDVKRRY